MRAGAFRGDLKCVLHLGGRMATGNKSFSVQGVEIHLATKGEEDYISLTDIGLEVRWWQHAH